MDLTRPIMPLRLAVPGQDGRIGDFQMYTRYVILAVRIDGSFIDEDAFEGGIVAPKPKKAGRPRPRCRTGARHAGGGRAAVRPGPGRGGIEFLVGRERGHLSVVPRDALPLIRSGRVDRRLFDVTELISAGYDDAHRDTLPLLVSYPKGLAKRAAVPIAGTRVTRELPAMAVRFAPPLAVDNTAPAGRPFTVPVTVERQPGAPAATVAALTVDVSYDGGKTWRKADLHRKGAGWAATLRHPTGPGYVSLRATARDSAGNTVTQRIIQAYRLR